MISQQRQVYRGFEVLQGCVLKREKGPGVCFKYANRIVMLNAGYNTWFIRK